MEKVLYQNLPAREAIRRITRNTDRKAAVKKVRDTIAQFISRIRIWVVRKILKGPLRRELLFIVKR